MSGLEPAGTRSTHRCPCGHLADVHERREGNLPTCWDGRCPQTCRRSPDVVHEVGEPVEVPVWSSRMPA